MARRKKKNQNAHASHDDAAVLTPRLLLQLHYLRLHSTDAYLDWCRRHGYEAKLRKTEIVLRRELEDWQRRTAVKALRRSRRARDPAAVLAAACRGELASTDVSPRLRSACERVEKLPIRTTYREGLAGMLTTVARRTGFLIESRRFGPRLYPYLDALINVHARRRDWIRPLDAFRPRTHNRERQFSELVRYLFTHYDVPAFLDAVWFRRDPAAASMRDWFVLLGRGHSLRTADTPVPVTRRIAHHFGAAPSHATVEGALRWAQIHALGGDAALADAVLDTPVGASLEHDAFWMSVFRFFVAQPGLRPNEVGPVIDFIRHQKFEPLEVVHPDGRVEERPPPKPHFTMRGRTLPALRAQVGRWHRMLARQSGGAGVWAPSGFRPFWEKTGTAARGNLKLWRIEELRSGGALAYEGRLMRHCVASYAAGCVRGTYSVWSLSLEGTDGVRKRLQTIQVSRFKSILQCRGKHNKLPSDAERRVILRWAAREGIFAGVLL